MANSIAYILGAVGVVGVTAAALTFAIAQSPNMDTAARLPNGCIRDQAPLSTKAMLVDFTDKPTAANISQLTKAFGDLRRDVPKDGKAIVAALDVNAESSVSTLLDVCNPGTKSGGAYAEAPGPSPQDQRWSAVYAKPFNAALDKAKQSPLSVDKSPLFEAVTAMSQRADFDGTIAHRQLIIVSDGLQLTPKVFSSFKHGDLWKAYIKSGLPPMTQADLTNVDVVFIYLLRPEYAQWQTEHHRAFLKRWFAEQGARSFQIRGIRNEEEG